MGTGSRALPGLGARWGVGLLALLIAAVMVSLAAGAYPVPLRDIPEVLLHAVFPGVFQAAPDPTAETVVIGLRLPRTVLAAIAGAGLAVSRQGRPAARRSRYSSGGRDSGFRRSRSSSGSRRWHL